MINGPRTQTIPSLILGHFPEGQPFGDIHSHSNTHSLTFKHTHTHIHTQTRQPNLARPHQDTTHSETQAAARLLLPQHSGSQCVCVPMESERKEEPSIDRKKESETKKDRGTG